MDPHTTTFMTLVSQTAGSHFKLEQLLTDFKCADDAAHNCLGSLAERFGTFIIDLGLTGTKLLIKSHQLESDKVLVRLIVQSDGEEFPELSSVDDNSLPPVIRHDAPGPVAFSTWLVAHATSHKKTSKRGPFFEMLATMLHSADYALTAGIKDIRETWANQKSIITCINHSRYTLQRSDSHAYKGGIRTTFEKLDPCIKIGEAVDIITSVGVFSSDNEYFAGSASAIQLTVMHQHISHDRFVVAASARTFGGKRFYMVETDQTDCKSLAARIYDKDGFTADTPYNAVLPKSGLHLSITVEANAYSNYCHVIVRITEPIFIVQ